FVHRTNEANSRENIVLQFVPGIPEMTPTSASPTPPLWLFGLDHPPKVSWRGTNQLEIVTPGIVKTMVVQKNGIDGVEVLYRFDGGPPTSWDTNLAGAKNKH